MCSVNHRAYLLRSPRSCVVERLRLWRRCVVVWLTCRVGLCAPAASSLSALLLCSLADHHHSQLQVAGLTQSAGCISMCDATQRLSIYRQHLISFLNGALLSCQAAGKHSVDLDGRQSESEQQSGGGHSASRSKTDAVNFSHHPSALYSSIGSFRVA